MKSQRIIKRTLFGPLLGHLYNQEISMIIGPRQAGKTTLMKMIQEHLQRQGEKCLFLNLDFETDNQYFVSQQALLNKIKLEFGQSKGFVFLDEIQRKENAGLFLKGIFDQQLPYKFIVSGSGSVELKEKIHESLAGRKRLFELYPVSLIEFIDYKTSYKYSERLDNFFEVEKEKSENLLAEYINFGGYPRIVLSETQQDKINEINEIYRSYIEKDIAYLLKIERIEAFSELVKLLSVQTGQLTNYSEISNTLGISLPTVKNYLWYAEKTFLVEKVTPFFKNLRKEITKSPIYYFFDLGLRNFAAGSFGNVNPGDRGFMFQNLVFHILKEKLFPRNAALHFWRTADKSEVDFVISKGTEIVPVEVKYRSFNKPQIERSFRNFLSHYRPKNAFVVNKNFRGKIEIDQTTITFFPLFDLLSNKLLF